MRIAVALLACIGAGALATTLADPTTEAAPTATSAPAAAAPAAPAAPTVAAPTSPAQPAAAATKAQPDNDTQHFLAQGYRPEMRHGEQIYCKRDTVLGSRLTAQKICGTIEQLKLSESGARENVSDLQRRQVGTTQH